MSPRGTLWRKHRTSSNKRRSVAAVCTFVFQSVSLGKKWAYYSRALSSGCIRRCGHNLLLLVRQRHHTFAVCALHRRRFTDHEWVLESESEGIIYCVVMTAVLHSLFSERSFASCFAKIYDLVGVERLASIILASKLTSWNKLTKEKSYM